jgi:hypothetical protein
MNVYVDDDMDDDVGDDITIPAHLLTAQHRRTAHIGILFSHIKPIFTAHIITQSIACYSIYRHMILYLQISIVTDMVLRPKYMYSDCQAIVLRPKYMSESFRR